MSDKNFTYKVIEEHESEPTLNVIEKGGVTVTFTMREIADNIRENEKMIKEFKGNIAIQKAKKENIEHHHPFVLKLTDAERLTVHMYEEACAYERALTPKLAEFEESVAELKEEQQRINKSIGIPIVSAVLESDIKPEVSKAVDL